MDLSGINYMLDSIAELNDLLKKDHVSRKYVSYEVGKFWVRPEGNIAKKLRELQTDLQKVLQKSPDIVANEEGKNAVKLINRLHNGDIPNFFNIIISEIEESQKKVEEKEAEDIKTDVFQIMATDLDQISVNQIKPPRSVRIKYSFFEVLRILPFIALPFVILTATVFILINR